jgi:hypothetical protein
MRARGLQLHAARSPLILAVPFRCLWQKEKEEKKPRKKAKKSKHDKDVQGLHDKLERMMSQMGTYAASGCAAQHSITQGRCPRT